MAGQGSWDQEVVRREHHFTPRSSASWTAPAVSIASMRPEQEDEPVPLSCALVLPTWFPPDQSQTTSHHLDLCETEDRLGSGTNPS